MVPLWASTIVLQEKGQADALNILRETTAVKSLKDMGKILWVDTASVVFYEDLDHRRKLFPFNLNGIAFFCVIESIFDNVADRF